MASKSHVEEREELILMNSQRLCALIPIVFLKKIKDHPT